MREDIKRYFRTAQTYFPLLPTVKTRVQTELSKVTNRPFEADFGALRLFGGKHRLCLDIGANRGQSIAALGLVTSGPKIVSFEPNPRLAAALTRRFGGLSDVRIEPVGLGDKEGAFDLHVPSYRRYSFDGLASFDREEAMSWLNQQTIVGFNPAKLSCQKVRCKIRTLDSFELAPFFAKFDVQGYELCALIGGRETLKRYTPVLMVETPGQEVVDYLRQFDYRPYVYHDRRRRFAAGVGGQNTFFMTDDKADIVSGSID